MSNQDIYNMQLHDEIRVKTNTGIDGGNSIFYIIRVPGGWIYQYAIGPKKETAQIFVSFDNEFMGGVK